MALGSTQPLTEFVSVISPSDKCGQCVGLTTPPHSCADCLGIWELQTPGTLPTALRNALEIVLDNARSGMRSDCWTKIVRAVLTVTRALYLCLCPALPTIMTSYLNSGLRTALPTAPLLSSLLVSSYLFHFLSSEEFHDLFLSHKTLSG